MCGKLLKAKEIGNCVRLRLIVRNQAKVQLASRRYASWVVYDCIK